MVVCSPAAHARSASPRLRGIVPASLCLFLFVTLPAPLFAQDGRSKHWGGSVFFGPQWKITESLRPIVVEGEGPIEGDEFTVGVVRGSRLGGEWGASFIRKKIKDTTIVDESGEQCFEGGGCNSSSETFVLKAVRLEGVEFHWFVPFVTIAERVQIGVNAAVGVVNVKGTIDETFVSTFTFNNQTQTNTQFEERAAKDVLWPIYPIGKVEAAVSVTAAPGLKVRVTGGFNFPGVGMRIGAVYLIGAR